MNGQIREKYLPVGTVVLLQNGTKRVMINGFCTMDASNPNRVFDYSGVLFPEGSLSSDQTLLFDHNQIVRIDHLGLEDEEEKSFKVKLKEIVASTAAVNNTESAAPTPQSTPQSAPQNPNMPPVNPMEASQMNSNLASTTPTGNAEGNNSNPFQGTNY